MRQITNGFINMSLPIFRQKIDLIVKSMTGNASFPTLQDGMPALAAEVEAYKNLATIAEGGNRGDIIRRDIAQAALIKNLHKLGRFVTAIADENEDMLSSSGFSYTQARKLTPDMPKPDAPIVGAGTNNGEINCRTARYAGMKSVNYYITTDAAALTAGESVSWDIVSWNKIKYTFTGLISGQRYYIRVGLVGVRGQEVISDPVSYIPQ